jgi:hypothetical protein
MVTPPEAGREQMEQQKTMKTRTKSVHLDERTGDRVFNHP